MHNILVLEGSPRQGNTSTVTDWVLAGMGRGIEVERVRVCEQSIHECQECYTCSKTKNGAGCAQDDDMVGLYEQMVDADLVIWTSPIFCWGITGRLKMVVDRCLALLAGESLLKGSRWALIATAGGDHFDGADLAVEMFRRLADFAKVEYLGQLVVANCPDGKKLKQNKAIEQQAREFGRELVRSLKTSV